MDIGRGMWGRRRIPAILQAAPALPRSLPMGATPKTGHKQDGMLVAGAIAAVAATALVFFAAWQTPVAHNAGGKRPSRAAVNAAEERRIWSRPAQ